VFNTSNTFFGKEAMSLRELLNALRETYCGTIGRRVHVHHRPGPEALVAAKLESMRSQAAALNAEKKKHILDRLTAAEGLERFLHTKYVGQKALLARRRRELHRAMDELIQQAGAKGVQEIVIGMAHRGRLNVLVNTLGKMPGDAVRRVRPHRARRPASRRREVPPGLQLRCQSTPGGPVHLSLAFNPSHLEIVNPVVEGSVRARMDRRGDPRATPCCPCWCTATRPSPGRAW
jgi:2-oxoglutarate dehydrogenase E1 component